MEMARQRDDFSDAKIDVLSDQCDLFFEAWVDLHGLSGMTNHFHMIGSGHMTYFLHEWCNIYQYSQQGWEALTSLIKNIYTTDGPRRVGTKVMGLQKQQTCADYKMVTKAALFHFFFLETLSK
jgi:hypothetical protein